MFLIIIPDTKKMSIAPIAALPVPARYIRPVSGIAKALPALWQHATSEGLSKSFLIPILLSLFFPPPEASAGS